MDSTTETALLAGIEWLSNNIFNIFHIFNLDEYCLKYLVTVIDKESYFDFCLVFLTGAAVHVQIFL